LGGGIAFGGTAPGLESMARRCDASESAVTSE
jgi:hypothetical protein